MNLDMDRQIHEIAAVCDYVQGLQKSPQAAVAVVRRMERLVSRARAAGAPTASGTFAPQLLEEVYNLEDALLVGGFVNTLLRNSDRVRVALPRADRQRHRAARDERDVRAAPEHLLSRTRGRCRYARGRVLDLRVESRDLSDQGGRPAGRLRARRQVPFVDVVATLDAPNGQARGADAQSRPRAASARSCSTGSDIDADARARLRDADRARSEGVQHVRAADARRAAARSTPPAAGGRMTFKLPPRSYTVAQIATG